MDQTNEGAIQQEAQEANIKMSEEEVYEMAKRASLELLMVRLTDFSNDEVDLYVRATTLHKHGHLMILGKVLVDMFDGRPEQLLLNTLGTALLSFVISRTEEEQNAAKVLIADTIIQIRDMERIRYIKEMSGIDFDPTLPLEEIMKLLKTSSNDVVKDVAEKFNPTQA